MTGTNRKSKADGNIASWKFRLEDTINADPDAPKAGLKVIRVYLHSYGEDNPYPYAAMSTLMAKTGLTAPTIRATRDKLVELGYLVERGVSADGKAAGATMYELRNPREAYVQKLVEERLRTFRDEAKERMRSHRAKDAAADVTAKNFPNTDDDTEACVRKETFRMFGKKFSECYSKKFTPNTGNNSGDNTVGAAHAAPHEGKGSDNNIRGGGPLRGRPPTGDRDEYPAGEQTEVHPFDDEEIFAHDDDGEGIPFDGGPVCAASEQREAPHRDVLAQCLRRADELGEHEQRLTHILAIRLREGHAFSEADRNALAAICRRLSIQFPVVDSHEDFADDLAAVRPDLSHPSARKPTEA